MVKGACRVMLLLTVTASVMTGCRQQTEKVAVSPEGKAEKPSENDPAGGQTPAANQTAVKAPVLYDSGYEEDNASCMVCHLDFETESISVAHLKAGLTCMACHGDSDDHRSDEFNIIRPDVLWGRAEIKDFCQQCHEEHKHADKVAAFREEWASRRRPSGRWIKEDSVCMDCHGEHAIMVGEGQFK